MPDSFLDTVKKFLKGFEMVNYSQVRGYVVYSSACKPNQALFGLSARGH